MPPQTSTSTPSGSPRFPLGAGVGMWFHNADVAGLHRRLVDHGVAIVQEPFDGPFGTTFSFRDADGYVVTVHSARA